MFSSYVPINRRKYLQIRGIGRATFKNSNIGRVPLKMTLERELNLNNVQHVPNINKNLIFLSILSNNSFKLVFESNKFALTKNEMYGTH